MSSRPRGPVLFFHPMKNVLPRRLAAALLLALASRAARAQALTNNGTALTVGPGATLFVAGGVLNNAGSTLQNDGLLQTTGDFTNAGQVSGTGRLRFTGAQDQTLTTPAGTVLANLEVANTGATGHNRLLVPADVTVSNALALATGLVRTTATAIVSLPNGATLTGEAPGRYVQGNLRVTRTAVSGRVDFGHGVVLDGTGQHLGVVSITRSAGLLTREVSYGTNPTHTTKGIDRIWTVQPTHQPTAPVALTLSWLPDDDNGLTDFSKTRLWQQPAAGSAWTPVQGPGDASGRIFTRRPDVLDRFTISNAANKLAGDVAFFAADGPTPAPTTANFAVEVFPVPLRAGETLRLFVHTDDGRSAMLLVTDAVGRTVWYQVLPLERGTTVFALPEARHWPAGIYFLKIQQGLQVRTVKILRE